MPLPEIVEEVLAEARVIAVLGAHIQEHKAAFYVPQYLHEHGYRVLPVNPVYAGRRLWGETVVASLAEVEGSIDCVDVFRRSEHLEGHLAELLAARPRWVWFQLGIRDDSVARRLEAAGVGVIQDRCLLADHGQWRPDRPPGATAGS